MRTFSKILSLVLCLAMMVGLCAFGASASDFTDDADIQYKEAVDLMVGLGVIEGMGDGTFNPAGILTRAQAAVIISKMLGEPKGLAGSTPFEDVPSGWWGEPYINYCYNAHIISGYSETSFGPNDTLKGNQFTLMLLRALGYNPENEGISGAGITWSEAQLPIAKLAKQNNLLAGIADYDATADVSRETALQMAFNTLKATLVEYPNSGTTIKTGDVEITTGASAAQKVEATDKTKDFMGIVANKETQQFAEEYFPGLAKGATTADQFGRPAESWTRNGKTLAVSLTDSPVLTYTAPFTNGKLYTDLGKPTGATVNVWTKDGAEDTTKAGLEIKSGGVTPLGGNGVLVEVYATDTAGKYDVVEINTYPDAIVDHTAATLDADGDVVDGKEEKVTIGAGSFITTAFSDNDTLAKTVVIYTKGAEGLASVDAAEKVTGKVEKIVAGRSITVDGTTYAYSANVNVLTGTSAAVVGKDADIYLDTYGYAIQTGLAVAAFAPKDYAYVAGVQDATLSTPAQAKLVFADGSTQVVNVKSIAGFNNTIVSYTVKDDVYTLTAGASLADTIAATPITTKGSAALSNCGAITTANAKTVFVVETKVTDGVFKYTAYTGYANTPALSTVAGGAVGAVATDANPAIAAFVFIKGEASTDVTSADFTYVLYSSMAPAVTDAAGTYYTFKAVKGGEITELNFDASLIGTAPFSGLAATDKVVLKAVTTNEDGIVTAVNDTATFTEVTEIGAAADGLIKLGSELKAYADTCKVFVADAGTITESSIAAIKADTNDKVVYTMNQAGTQVVSIYILKVAD